MFTKFVDSIQALSHSPKYLAAVVIPVYKSEPDPYEITSLIQCLKVFPNHSIIFVFPEDLNLTSYKKLCHGYDVQWKSFDIKYFASIEGYNDLMLSRCFYEAFTNYSYILIHQLDAFTFRNELDYWCSLNYDYIGSPWINTWKQPDVSRTNWLKHIQQKIQNADGFVGNGGYSLRKVKSFIIALALLSKEAKGFPYNEDMFFSYYVPRKFPFFSIPSFQLALKFSFETEPNLCFQLNNRQLPFGCHAWDKNYDSFWKDHIELEETAKIYPSAYGRGV
jgi:Protein of unknown function (DUF5672)